MTQFWFDSTIIGEGVLFLPELQVSSPINQKKLTRSKGYISIPFSGSFFDVWCNGPHDTSLSSLTHCLGVLGMGFNTFVRAGQGNVAVREKTKPDDLVTDMDAGIEMLFRLWIQQFFPDHKVIGEEGIKETFSTKDVVWYVDPVDGTSNFVRGTDNVTVHLGAVYNGKPYVSFVGVPFHHFGLLGSSEQPVFRLEEEHSFLLSSSPHYSSTSRSLVIGTEYRDSKFDQDGLYKSILDLLNASSFRVQSIGCNLLALLDGSCDVFYKPILKLWDALAPICLLDFHYRDKFEIELYYPKDYHHKRPFTPSDFDVISPFSNDALFVKYLNQRHQDSCRVGFLIVYPKDRPDIKETIFSEFGNYYG